MSQLLISEIKNLGREKLKELCQTNPDFIVDLIFELLDKIEKQQVTIKAQQIEIEKLTLRVKELDDKLNLNSSNSSKPPSKDPPNIHFLKKREKSGKPKGGQPGHKGTTIKFSETPDNIIELHPEKCMCGETLHDVEPFQVNKRQLKDIPPLPEIVTTEYHQHLVRCPRCKKICRKEYPANVKQRVQYGENLKTLLVYFRVYNFLSYQRIAEVMQDLFHVEISEGTIANTLKNCYGSLENFEVSSKERMLKSEILHFDETGINVDGKQHWLHAVSNSEMTLFFPDPKRGSEAMDRINILPQYEGHAVHDCWSPYNKYKKSSFSLCNAHTLRDLECVKQQFPHAWATFMKNLLIEACAEKNAGTLKYENYEKRIRMILDYAEKENPLQEKPPGKKRMKKTKSRLLYERFINYFDAIFAFMTDSKIPFTNNLVERDQRMMKVHQKISGCFRSFDHAEFFCRIRSYISTLIKNKQNVFNSLLDVFSGKIFMPQIVSAE